MVEDQELREQSTERERLEQLFYYDLKGLEDFFSGHIKMHIRWDWAIKSTLKRRSSSVFCSFHVDTVTISTLTL